MLEFVEREVVLATLRGSNPEWSLSMTRRSLSLKLSSLDVFLDRCVLSERINLKSDESFTRGEEVEIEITILDGTRLALPGIVAEVQAEGVIVVLERELKPEVHDLISSLYERRLRKFDREDGPILGIDLGTTNTLAAVLDGDGRPQLLRFADGSYLLPSVIAFDKDWRKIVGGRAKDQMVINPDRSVFGAKRLLGRKLRSLSAEMASFFPYNLVEGDEGEVAVEIEGLPAQPASTSAVMAATATTRILFGFMAFPLFMAATRRQYQRVSPKAALKRPAISSIFSL